MVDPSSPGPAAVLKTYSSRRRTLRPDGRSFVGPVAFEFTDTRIRGVPLPGYRVFPEVNLRFYVRGGDEWVFPNDADSTHEILAQGSDVAVYPSELLDG